MSEDDSKQLNNAEAYRKAWQEFAEALKLGSTTLDLEALKKWLAEQGVNVDGNTTE